MVERIGVFDDTDHLVSDLRNAHRNQMFPDVTFVLSDYVTIQTNRLMLVWRSKYFATKLLGMKEEDEKVVMNCDSKTFQLLLDYMWEGKVDFSNLKLKHLLELLKNARMMILERLVTRIQEYISYLLEAGQLDIEEYWTVLEFCSINGYEEIQTSALKFIDKNFNTVCSSNTSFAMLSSDVIFTVLENKNGTVKGVDIFIALTLWLENQPSPVEDSIRAALLGMIDLAAMKPLDLLGVVRKSGLYTDMNICDALEKQIDTKSDEVALSRASDDNEENDKENTILLDKHFMEEDDRSLTTQQYEVEENVFADKCEDHEKAPPRDEAQEDEQDRKSSPHRGSSSSLLMWWKTRDSLLSPSKGM